MTCSGQGRHMRITISAGLWVRILSARALCRCAGQRGERAASWQRPPSRAAWGTIPLPQGGWLEARAPRAPRTRVAVDDADARKGEDAPELGARRHEAAVQPGRGRAGRRRHHHIAACAVRALARKLFNPERSFGAEMPSCKHSCMHTVIECATATAAASGSRAVRQSVRTNRLGTPSRAHRRRM